MIGVLIGKPNKPTGYRFVEPIKAFNRVPGSQVRLYLTTEPCIITDMNDSCHTADRSEIVSFDPRMAVARVGRFLKMPVSEIGEVAV